MEKTVLRDNGTFTITETNSRAVMAEPIKIIEHFLPDGSHLLTLLIYRIRGRYISIEIGKEILLEYKDKYHMTYINNLWSKEYIIKAKK